MGEKETWEDPGQKVKGSKSNTSERLAQGDLPGRDEPVEAVKSSKSNTSDRLAQGDPGEPAEAVNLNSSKSN